MIQHALEIAHSDDARGALAAELRGHVWEAMQCPHANHVLQRCITRMPPGACRFIVEEIERRGVAAVSKAARHPYACRVLQRLLEHFPPGQLHGLTEALLADSLQLSSHRYGNYVMQHVLEHGVEGHRRHLTGELAHQGPSLGQNPYACMVLGKALSYASPGDAAVLAHALVERPGLIAAMAQTRHGHMAAQLVFRAAGREDLDEACRQLSEELPSLRANRYGRTVLKCLKQHRRGGPAALGGA